MEDKIQLIKDIRWIYHKASEAQHAIEELAQAKYNEHAPAAHTLRTLKELELELLDKITEFNQWLKENTSKC